MKSDELEKLNYYKKQIMKDFITKATYPSVEELNSKLEALNLSESYYKTVLVSNGELFNTQVFNAQSKALGEDLNLLYKLLKEMTQTRIDYLSQFADTNLTALEKKVSFYLNKSKLEVQSSDLGYTAYYNEAPFIGEQVGEYFYIDCGNIKLTNGSSIYLLVEGNDINYARLTLDNGLETFYVTPYGLNRQYFKVPGEPKINEIQVTSSSTPKAYENVLVPYTDIKENCEYVILTGKDNVATKASNKSNYSGYKQCVCYERTMIDFYVKDASSIQIRVSNTPLNTNYDFSQEVIKLEKGIKHFYLEMPEKSGVEIFLDGGSIYAQKAKGVIRSNLLYFIHNTPFKDFLILEKTKINQTNFKATLEVKSTSNNLGIQNIMIKELI